MKAVLRAAAAAVRRRRVQSAVIGTVALLSAATAVLAAGLLTASTAPFDRAFARQHGAHAAVTFDAAKVAADTLSASAARAGVTAAGPYDVVRATMSDVSGGRTPPLTIAGRAEASPAVDRLQVTAGAWLTGPGQVVLGGGDGGPFPVGDTVTVGGVSLKVVGYATSVTGTADAWVWPSQSDVLGADRGGAGRQLLYRFAAAASEADVRAGVAAATAGLPADAVGATTSYLAVRLKVGGNLAAMVPFVVTFALLGLVMSVLIVANVVSGAVVAGYRTIGVLKSLGFSPPQVVAVYAGQALLVCAPAGVLGVALGNLLAAPLLADTQQAYGLPGPTTVPFWLSAAVLAGVLVAVGLAAIAPAARAGRLSATQAITVGRAPHTGRGYRVRRALAATRLPRPVSFGLGTPFARPARSAMTVVAVLLGATTVVLAIGLSASFSMVKKEFGRAESVPVTVDVLKPGPNGEGGHRFVKTPLGPQEVPVPSVDPEAVRRAILAQPGTRRVVGITLTEVDVAGAGEPVRVEGYDGDASWVGYPLISGRWYRGSDEAVAGSRMLHLTGIRVGDTITVSTGRGQRRVRIVGEVLSRSGSPMMVMNQAGVEALGERTGADRFEVAVATGTDPRRYARALGAAVNSEAVLPAATADLAGNKTLNLMIGLVATLGTLLSAVAALGVVNTVVLNTRERVHEIGVLKSVGMTPGQIRTMVVASMVVLGAAGGALAVPLGYLLHRRLLPIIANAAGTGVPRNVMAVYTPATLAGCALLGVVLAVVGALAPATWAGRTRASTALRAE